MFSDFRIVWGIWFCDLVIFKKVNRGVSDFVKKVNCGVVILLSGFKMQAMLIFYLIAGSVADPTRVIGFWRKYIYFLNFIFSRPSGIVVLRT